MLSDLDETIRQLLINEGEFDPAEIDISFDIPNREWSSGISKPTLNCYLFDIHERRALREEGWQLQGRGTREAARRAPPLFFEMTYLVTAWTSAVEDEHRLLWHMLEVLMDHPVLPEARLQGDLRQYDWPLHTSVAQLEGVLRSPGEFWTALENQIKPSLSYVVTVARERRAERAGPPVLPGGISIGLPEARPGEGFRVEALFRLRAETPRGGIAVRAAGHDHAATTDADGRFVLDLPEGQHLLRATIDGVEQQRMVRIGGVPYRYTDIVRDQRGTPLGGIRVQVAEHTAEATTDGDGRFALDLPPGMYTLLLDINGRMLRRRITVRERVYTLTLAIGGVAGDDTHPTANARQD